MVESNKAPKNEKKEIRIIGQGTYGCAYHPSISCKDQKVGSARFLSKIQVKDNISDLENAVGQIIKRIPNYQYYFAPVIEQCPINISSIDNDNLKKCDVIAEGFHARNAPNYVSSKIRYVGDETLDDYFTRILHSKHGRNPIIAMQKYWKTLGNSHLYILQSVYLLNQAGILHLDIKENNVMRDPKNDVFIVIDFGLAYESKNLNRTNYAQSKSIPFGVRTDSYVPWCIEINILSYIARLVQPLEKKTSKYGELQEEKWSEKVRDVSELKEICNKFMKTNALLRSELFSEDERKDYLRRLHRWIDGMREKTWGGIWDLVQNSHVSWDAYSVSTMFLKELAISNVTTMLNELPQLNRPDPGIQEQAKSAVSQIFAGPPKNDSTKYTYFMQEYVKLLKRNILSDPETRVSAEKLQSEMRPLFKNIEIEAYNAMNNQVAPKVLENKNLEKMVKKKRQNTLHELRQEQEIRKKYIRG
jgi:serine/threonine protein kinase